MIVNKQTNRVIEKEQNLQKSRIWIGQFIKQRTTTENCETTGGKKEEKRRKIVRDVSNFSVESASLFLGIIDDGSSREEKASHCWENMVLETHSTPFLPKKYQTTT